MGPHQLLFPPLQPHSAEKPSRRSLALSPALEALPKVPHHQSVLWEEQESGKYSLSYPVSYIIMGLSLSWILPSPCSPPRVRLSYAIMLMLQSILAEPNESCLCWHMKCKGVFVLDKRQKGGGHMEETERGRVSIQPWKDGRCWQ